MNKYHSMIDLGVKLQEDFLSLTLFQQWVLCMLYNSKMYQNGATKSAEDLMINACMSAIEDGFSETTARDELADLVTKNMIVQPYEDERYQITVNGSFLVKSAVNKVYTLLTNPNFDNLMEKITSESVTSSLWTLKHSDDYPDAVHTTRKITQCLLTPISEWSHLILILVSEFKL